MGVTFSIIIPARNEERNIGRCLDSIAALEWSSADIEVIVVDNGSSDRTADISQAYGAAVLLRPDCTVSALRNVGAAQSVGRILVFLDADCTVPPRWLHPTAQYLSRDDVVCFGSPPVIPQESTLVQRAWFHVRKKTGAGQTDWLESMNMFVRRDAFEKVGGFNADLVTCEDYDLSVRLRAVGSIISDDSIVAVHHGEAASLAHFFRKEHWRALGNVRGMKSHSFNWREIPSVAIPIVYCLFALAMSISLLGVPYLAKGAYLPAALLLVWQIPLALLALRKIGEARGVVAASQLFVLLNVYFFARGLASLRCK